MSWSLTGSSQSQCRTHSGGDNKSNSSAIIPYHLGNSFFWPVNLCMAKTHGTRQTSSMNQPSGGTCGLWTWLSSPPPHTPPTSRRTFRDRAPTLWNCLPVETGLVPTLGSFKSALKRHKQAVFLHPFEVQVLQCWKLYCVDVYVCAHIHIYVSLQSEEQTILWPCCWWTSISDAKQLVTSGKCFSRVVWHHFLCHKSRCPVMSCEPHTDCETVDTAPQSEAGAR